MASFIEMLCTNKPDTVGSSAYVEKWVFMDTEMQNEKNIVKFDVNLKLTFFSTIPHSNY